MKRLGTVLGLAALVLLPLRMAAAAAEDPARHWDLASLGKAPAFRELKGTESDWKGLKALLVEGRGPKDAKAAFFCYYGVPAGTPPAGGFPGVVLVHGGGGTAFPNYVEDWVRLGFAVIAPDWYNRRPAPALTNVPPRETSVPRLALPGGCRQDHAANVANMVLAHSLLRSFPEVNADRTVFVGLSWGSWYGTCVAAVDDRFRGCVEIYCGDFNPARPALHALVNGQFLPAAKVPMWWAVSTNDRNVTPETSTAGFAACARFAGVTLVNDLPHSHVGFSFPSVQRMARYFTGSAKRLPHLGAPTCAGATLSAPILDPGAGVDHALLCYTLSKDPVTWKRPWKTQPAACAGGRVSATLPEGTIACYLAAYEKESSRFRDLCGTTVFFFPKAASAPALTR